MICLLCTCLLFWQCLVISRYSCLFFGSSNYFILLFCGMYCFFFANSRRMHRAARRGAQSGQPANCTLILRSFIFCFCFVYLSLFKFRANVAQKDFEPIGDCCLCLFPITDGKIPNNIDPSCRRQRVSSTLLYRRLERSHTLLSPSCQRLHIGALVSDYSEGAKEAGNVKRMRKPVQPFPHAAFKSWHVAFRKEKNRLEDAEIGVVIVAVILRSWGDAHKLPTCLPPVLSPNCILNAQQVGENVFR